jgi:ATP-binding cassette, subfamily C, bacterial
LWAFTAIGVRPTLGIVLAVYFAIIAIETTLQRCQAGVSVRLQQEVITALRVRLYRAIAAMSWPLFARRRASEFSELLTVEVERVGAAAYYLVDWTISAAIASVYLALALRVSPSLTALVLACGAVQALMVRKPMARLRRFGEGFTESSQRFHATIAEHLAGMKIAKTHAAERRNVDTFAQQAREMNHVGLAAVGVESQLRQRLSLAAAAMLAIVVYVAYEVLAVPTAHLLLLIFLFARLGPRLTGLYDKAQRLVTVLPSFAAVSDAEARCLAAAEPAVADERAIAFTRRIECDDVTFKYGESHTAALRAVSVTIDAGTTTAIVGPSGAGKSTFADVLLGLMTPSHGRILVDGERLTPDCLRSWRGQIGYASQDPFLFHDTVRANLLWAKPDATDQELWRALEHASADTFVSGLPNGLDTVVGDRGVLLSGGERQRLSFARALVRQPRLLILDESTSSVDTENEVRIHEAVAKLHGQMTIVIITHRLSTIRQADMIHVIDGGRRVESGRWDDLMARPTGRFRTLYCARRESDAKREGNSHWRSA